MKKMIALLSVMLLSSVGVWAQEKIDSAKLLRRVAAQMPSSAVSTGGNWCEVDFSYKNPTISSDFAAVMKSLKEVRASLSGEEKVIWDEAVFAILDFRETLSSLGVQSKTGDAAKKQIANFAIQEVLVPHRTVIERYNRLYSRSPKAARELNKLIWLPFENNGVKYLMVDIVHQGLLNTLFSTNVIHGEMWIGFKLPRTDVDTVLKWCQKADPAFKVAYNWGTLS